MPSPGLVRALGLPGGPGVRNDCGVAAGFEIPTAYDSMLAKLITWGDTRADAIATLTRALDEYRVVGLKTTVPFFQWVVRQPEFLESRFDTTWLDGILAGRRGRPFVDATAADEADGAIAAALAAWLRAHRAVADASPEPGGPWRRLARQDGLRQFVRRPVKGGGLRK
jgi:acetyl-CoA carboxylase biotin carboxylase subunit